jgi:hypothetical protein
MPQLINFYKITSTNTNLVYVGSTGHSIHERLLRHEFDYVNYKNGYGNRTTSHEIIIFKNYSIHLLETALCLTKDDRNAIEQKHILNAPSRVNKVIPGRTKAQLYYQDNKIKNSVKIPCYCYGSYTKYQRNTKTFRKHHNTCPEYLITIFLNNRFVVFINVSPGLSGSA